MSDKPQSWISNRQIGLAALVSGVGLIALSLLWDQLPPSRSKWTAEQADRYQQLSVEFHHLSHALGPRHSDHADEEVPAELGKIQAEFDGLSRELETARSQPARLAAILRLVGVVASIAGAAAYYAAMRS